MKQYMTYMVLLVFLKVEDWTRKRINEYFQNLPYKEETIRAIIGGLKDSGYFYKGDFDPATVDLAQIITPPSLGHSRGGLRIIELTEGGKPHHPQRPGIPVKLYDNVPDNQTYVTIDDTYMLSGAVTTYKFEQTPEGLKLLEQDIHIRS